MAETLDIHFEFQNNQQKEEFKTALRGFVANQQRQAGLGGGGGAGLGGGGESYGFGGGQGGRPAGIGFGYINFIPGW